MHRMYDQKLHSDRVTLSPGEFFASHDPIILHTVLGSCIAVCLWDPALHCGGMNHFMLPAVLDQNRTFCSDSARYGMNAMELLINKMLSLGVERRRLVGKVFGGAHVLDTGSSRSELPDSNTAFAMQYLETERIPVVAQDVGGTVGRQIRFALGSGAVYVRRLGSGIASRVASRERKYEVVVPARPVELFEPPPLPGKRGCQE
jgi:chemotaxis protein CheD